MTPEPNRRELIRWAGLGLAGLMPLACNRPGSRMGVVAVGQDELLRFPGKVPMRAINNRPPCLETPWEYYRTDFTPNEAFYVRWHLGVIPTEIDTRTWRLRVGGAVENPLELSLADLQKMPTETIPAVNQCSGNSRGLFTPVVPGAQWSNGGMGNARWAGVPLRIVLEKAGLKKTALEVSFQGLDKGGLPSVPDYIKTLTVERAQSPEILLAWAMNDEPLPLLNGFPLRLVIPGWYATYWVKSLSQITVLDKPFEGFWMAKAYRIPTTANAVEEPKQLATKTVPIHRMNVRSFFTTPSTDARIPRNQEIVLDGIAFDGGSGIRQVDLSFDDGKSWQKTDLGNDHGKYSFRRWTMPWKPTEAGVHRLLVRATSQSGETQPLQAGWNRSGYMRNVVESLDVVVI